MMTIAWMSIDILGRRKLMIWVAAGLATSFTLLIYFGGLAKDCPQVPDLAVEIPSIAVLFSATAIFDVGWLATVWPIPTQIYLSTARAQGSAISVIIWGLANSAVTSLTPIGFKNLEYWLFLIFAGTNTFAGWWTLACICQTGGRSFEENQEVFGAAMEDGSWVVRNIDCGGYRKMPSQTGRAETGGKEAPSLRRSISP